MILQAVPEEEFQKIKKELHGVHATTSALRFAESAEQQHMEVNELPTQARPSPDLLRSSNYALAGRLAPSSCPLGSLQAAGPSQTQVSGQLLSCALASTLRQPSLHGYLRALCSLRLALTS